MGRRNGLSNYYQTNNKGNYENCPLEDYRDKIYFSEDTKRSLLGVL